KAVTEYAKKGYDELQTLNIEEIAGHGLKGLVDGKEVLAGNAKLLNKFEIPYPKEIEQIVDTIVVLSIDKRYAGYITIADEIKEDAQKAVNDLHTMGIR